MELRWSGGILTWRGETVEDGTQRRDHKLACYYPQPHSAWTGIGRRDA
jgi:hypothetical protein